MIHPLNSSCDLLGYYSKTKEVLQRNFFLKNHLRLTYARGLTFFRFPRFTRFLMWRFGRSSARQRSGEEHSVLRAGAAWSHWRLTGGRPRGYKRTSGGCSGCYRRSTGGSGGQESRGRGDSDGVEMTSVTSAEAVSGHEVGEAVDVVTDLGQSDLDQHENKRGWSLQHDVQSTLWCAVINIYMENTGRVPHMFTFCHAIINILPNS